MKKLLRAFRRAITWHRRPLAAIVAVLGTLALLAALSPERPVGHWAVVTSRAVRAGATIEQADLRRVHLPEASLPDGFLDDIGQVVGLMAVGALPLNAIITPADVFTPGGLQASAGKAIMPLRLPDDGLRGLLKVGSTIDLIGINSRSGEAEILARSVRVVAIPAVDDPQGFGTTSSGGLLVLVEVTPDAASQLSTASLSSRLSVILR